MFKTHRHNLENPIVVKYKVECVTKTKYIYIYKYDCIQLKKSFNIQVSLDGSNSDLLKFSISRSITGPIFLLYKTNLRPISRTSDLSKFSFSRIKIQQESTVIRIG